MGWVSEKDGATLQACSAPLSTAKSSGWLRGFMQCELSKCPCPTQSLDSEISTQEAGARGLECTQRAAWSLQREWMFDVHFPLEAECQIADRASARSLILTTASL